MLNKTGKTYRMSALNKTIMEVCDLPIFQNVSLPSHEEALNYPKGNVRLAQNQNTGLVFNADFQPERVVYNENYQNEQSLSSSFKIHLDQVADFIAPQMQGGKILEIGCGKGTFLELLLARDWDAYGMDISYEGNNSRVRKALYDNNISIKYDGIILRHVLEHIFNPLDFLSNIKEANGGNGLIYIEVPCFDWIIDHRAWFDIYYEHVNYFRINDFYRMFGDVIRAERLFGDQYLGIVADIATLRTPEMKTEDKLESQLGIFAGLQLLKSLPNRPRAIWGAASKGVIFAIHAVRAGVDLKCAIDVNPAKQGRFLPCTALPVMNPQDALQMLPKDTEIFVMNSNYLEEIATITGGDFELTCVESLVG